MSESIGFKNVEDPDKELDDEAINILVGICQDSFSRDEMPDKEDAVNHIASVDNLVTAIDEDEDELVGFSSSLMLDDEEYYVIQHGLAVDEDYQGEKLGEMLVDLVTLASTDADEVWIGGRTQADFYIKYIQDRHGFPREVETLDFFEDPLNEFKDFYPSDGSEDHILVETYNPPNYSENELEKMTENIREFVNEEYNPYRGDGILALAHIPTEMLLENYLCSKKESDFEINLENFKGVG